MHVLLIIKMARVEASFSLICLLLLAIFPQSWSLLAYQGQIPNGNRVPHPCDRTLTWPGVGHENSQGGGTQTQFGLDFLANGHSWTNALCRADSDGDGRTNGEELGDPNCQWTPFATPWITNASLLSHPGVCEPITSPGCLAKNTFLTKNSVCVLTLNSISTSTVTTTKQNSASTKSTASPSIMADGYAINVEKAFFISCATLLLTFRRFL